MGSKLAVAVALMGLLGASWAKADEQSRIRAQRQAAWANNPYAWVNGQGTYNPAYGYSTGMGRPNYYGNSAPLQGNFRFLPGSGYGSIYGNGGHPGFGSYMGPAWGNPRRWGY